jgi:hypothetical protein
MEGRGSEVRRFEKVFIYAATRSNVEEGGNEVRRTVRLLEEYRRDAVVVEDIERRHWCRK